MKFQIHKSALYILVMIIAMFAFVSVNAVWISAKEELEQSQAEIEVSHSTQNSNTLHTKLLQNSSAQTIETFVSFTTFSETELIPFEEIIIEDDSMYEDEVIIKSEGNEGIMLRTFCAIQNKQNNDEEQLLIDERIISEPVNKEIIIGTRKVRTTGDKSFVYPKLGVLTSNFGVRVLDDNEEFHSGLDIAANIGDVVVAAKSGTVITAEANGDNGGYGKYVKIQHDDGIVTLYGHLSKVSVSVGDYIKQGHEIGLAGDTGRVTGPHLHFEIIVNGRKVNPLPYLVEGNVLE